MKHLLSIFLLIPIMALSQQESELPSWSHSVVSDLPFQSPINNEFRQAAEELMAKKWTKDILNIVIESKIKQDIAKDKMLFVLQIKDRSATRQVEIPIRVSTALILDIQQGNREALERFSEETERWILRYI